MSRKEAEELFDNNFDCYTYEEGLRPEEDVEQPAMTREKFIELTESHIGNVSGQVCAECKRKDEIIKWYKFYDDLREKIYCLHCDSPTECKDCEVYKDLLKEHKLEAAQN